jgi:hypothetical protein
MRGVVGNRMKRIGTVRALLAVAAIALVAAVAGCGRTTLRPGAADSGLAPSQPEVQDTVVRDQGTDPQVEPGADGKNDRLRSEMGPEAGPETPQEVSPEAGPEIRREAGPEAGPEIGREAGPEAGPETGREAGPEAGPEANPEVGRETGREIGRETGPEVAGEAGPSTCVRASNETKTLATLDGQPLTSALFGDTVFLGTLNGGTAETPPTGAIVAVSLSTGNQTKFPLGGNIPGHMVVGPGALFYSPGKVVAAGSGAWRFEYSTVARLELATGRISLVDSSPLLGTFGIGSVVANAKQEVFWSVVVDADGRSALKRWDEATQAPQTILDWGQTLPLLVDNDHFYWSELVSSLHVRFLSMPTEGGAVVQIYESPAASPDAPSLAAVDDERLYYVFPGSPSEGIVAMPKAGGAGQTVVANAVPILFGSQTIDGSHLYWVDQSDQGTIRRTAKTGTGGIELFWSGALASITTIAIDACNVYWTPGYPNELRVRGK